MNGTGHSYKKSILLVDDDRDTVQLYHTFFSYRGYDVVGIAYDGDDAIETYSSLEVKPDIVLLDHWMPGKTGIEAAGAILSINPEARIIMASSDADVSEEAFRVGVKMFLMKPLSLKMTIDVIESIIYPVVHMDEKVGKPCPLE